MIDKRHDPGQDGSRSSRRSRCSRPPAPAGGQHGAERGGPQRRRTECGSVCRRLAERGGGGTYKIGYSNGGGVGNGFREEQVCTAKAEALASGQVSELTTIHRNTDAAGQLQDIRDLIAADVDAIVFNPNDPDALNPALEEAKAAGIKTVSVDAYVTDPDTYNLYNNQVEYAYLGAKWLFEQLGGKGNVWYTRGIAGNPADTDRDIGFKQALAENPGIKVVPPERRPHRLGSGQGHPARQRVRLQRRVRRRPGHLDVGHGLPGRRCHQGRRQAVRADRRRRPRRVRRPAPEPD